jgi:hypothetical protein
MDGRTFLVGMLRRRGSSPPPRDKVHTFARLRSVSARVAISAVADAEAAIALIDALEADPARQAALVGSIPP